jgi:energy-coupling factor transporter ATP-binding protein EcfA2
MLRQPNLLILDEPTNHLDLEARDALMHALREYDGTLLVVSHDRHFVSAVGTRVLAISPDGMVEDFAGGYEEYLERRGEDYLATAGTRRRPRRDSLADADTGSGHTVQHKRGAVELTHTVEKCEREVGVLEGEIAELETRFAAPGYYERTPHTHVEADSQHHSDLREKLGMKFAEWERAAAELEVLESGRA